MSNLSSCNTGGESFRVLLTPEDGFDSLTGAANFVIRKKYAEDLAPSGGLSFAPLEPKFAPEYAAFADSLVLTDGGEIHRGRYGGIYSGNAQMSAVSQTRDELEFALFDAFFKANKPVFGFGRGMLLINVALDGTLDESGTQILRLAEGLTAIRQDGKTAAIRHVSLPIWGTAKTQDYAQTDELRDFAAFSANLAAIRKSAARPPVLIAGGPAYDRKYRTSSVMTNKTYVAAIAAGGGLPLLALGEPAQAENYAASTNGLVLTGTQSFTPDQTLLPTLTIVENSARNAFDKQIYYAFKEKSKPILGICLGLQIINVFEGGTLRENFKQTDGTEHMLSPHRVSTCKDSVLYTLFGANFIVNSRHNDRIDVLAELLKATAYSPDGVIEAVEHRSLPIWAVQWHPERTRGDFSEPYNGVDMTPLFQFFAQFCSA